MRDPQAVAAMQCPVCHVALAMSDRAGIEIDYCPQCRGVWLDRGELDKIIERSGADAASPASQPPQSQPPQYQAPQYQAPPQSQPWSEPQPGYGHGHDPRYGRKRKKSFFEDLFD